jgi:hypothetical protein
MLWSLLPRAQTFALRSSNVAPARHLCRSKHAMENIHNNFVSGAVGRAAEHCRRSSSDAAHVLSTVGQEPAWLAGVLARALAPLEAKLEGIECRMNCFDARLSNIEESSASAKEDIQTALQSIDKLSEKSENGFDRIEAKMFNQKAPSGSPSQKFQTAMVSFRLTTTLRRWPTSRTWTALQ